MKRRQFLFASCGLVAGSTFSALASARTRTSDGRLVLIFLRGGLDGLFVFAPRDDPRLPELRPKLSQRLLTEGAPLAGTGFSAHPAAHALTRMFNEKELAFAPCCGTNDRSRSHFQAQDIFEFGNGSTRSPTGMFARVADWLDNRYGSISFTSNLPGIFQGAENLPGIAPLSGATLALPVTPGMQAIRRMHRNQATGEALDKAIQTSVEIESSMTRGMDPKAARGAAGIASFPASAASMAGILRENPRLALSFIDIGGFDTHAGEESALTRNLGHLGQGLLALREGLGQDEWRRTQVLVCTEFGRTARENGTNGTDHGHGGLALLLGGSITGGRQIGGFDGLADNALNDKRDLPVLVDWRSLIANSLRDTLGASKADLQKLLPGLPGLV